MHKYEILDIIDQGAYGIVWKAVNKDSQQFVAIKEFKQTDQDEENRKTIQREIKMLKMLKGDFVVGIREAFKKKGKIYLIFQFFPKNLLNVIEVFSEGLEASLIQQIVYKIVKCLRFFHNKNIIHRDIKPENILLSEKNDVLKLCDLGFARFIPENTKQMTDYVATRWYRSPELLVGQPYGKASDMFALGCMIGELVDGQPMFPGEDQVDQIFLLKKTIGELTTNQYRCLFANTKFNGSEVPQVKKRETLQERYLGKIQKNALSFMKACLKMNAQERLTADEALKHPYLIELSTQDKQFDNDEQNLLKYDRKTIIKNQSRHSILSVSKYEEEQKTIEDISQSTSKLQSIAKKKLGSNIKLSYGSVDYTEEKSEMKKRNNSNFEKSEILKKKNSFNTIVKPKRSSPDPFNAKTKANFKAGGLNKNMSEQKHLKVNLDVNVNINLKINKRGKELAKNNHRQIPNSNEDSIMALSPKKSTMIKNPQHGSKGEGFNNKSQQLEQLTSVSSSKLPELRNHPKGFVQKHKTPVINNDIAKRIGARSNLSIYGHSKQMSQQLLSRKLGHIN